MDEDAGTLHADLARFYDQEAAARAERGLASERVDAREQFIRLLREAGAKDVLEIGTGPGRDAAAFVADDFRVAGIDLSTENVRLAHERGIDAHVAAAEQMPFPDDSFDAVWCMSVVMHMPDDELDRSLAEMVRVVRPGSISGSWLVRRARTDSGRVRPQQRKSLTARGGR